MPFIDTCKSALIPTFYNVVHAVGSHCPNKMDDVKLVQLMLQIIYQPSADDLYVDGYCGPKTKKWIRKFQMDLLRSGTPTLVDERVDRARNHGAVGSISRTRYTIISLNEIVKTMDPAAWAEIRSALPMTSPEAVPPAGNDYVGDAPVKPALNNDPPWVGGRTRTSPAMQSTSPK